MAMRAIKWKLVFAAASLLYGSSAWAQQTIEGEGRALAVKTCSACHSIEKDDGPSKTPAAPAFSAIAAMPSATLLSLRVFLRSHHTDMPAIVLTDDQISAISEYILDFRAK